MVSSVHVLWVKSLGRCHCGWFPYPGSEFSRGLGWNLLIITIIILVVNCYLSLLWTRHPLCISSFNLPNETVRGLLLFWGCLLFTKKASKWQSQVSDFKAGVAKDDVEILPPERPGQPQGVSPYGSLRLLTALCRLAWAELPCRLRSPPLGFFQHRRNVGIAAASQDGGVWVRVTERDSQAFWDWWH